MNVVVFSPHPDDAEVMMGGTIAKYAQKGHNVSIVLVTIPNQKEKRRDESKKAAAILGANLSVLDLNPYELVYNRSLVEIFDQVIKDSQPDIIYTSWIHDSHQDHITVSKASITAARKNNCSLYMYDQGLPSGLDSYAFRAQAFADISGTMEIKVKGISAHDSQVQKYGQRWIQGIMARATYLGYRINTKYAEAFEVVREIERIY
ncbi:N-acetyl-alpha-D-glucosaminyl L-malate deacetylase 1 [subsurface metagenome]